MHVRPGYPWLDVLSDGGMDDDEEGRKTRTRDQTMKNEWMIFVEGRSKRRREKEVRRLLTVRTAR